VDFFSETSDVDGLIGLSLTLRSKDLEFTPAFREFVSPFKSKCGEIETAFDLTFLSKTKSPLGIYCFCHGHIIEDKLRHFLISLRRKPKSEPPQEMIQASEKLGGYPGGLSNFFSALGEQEVTWGASLHVAILKPKRWPLKASFQKMPRNVGSFRARQQELRLKNAKLNVNAVLTLSPDITGFALEINSDEVASSNTACFDEVGEQLWSKAKSLFDRK